MAFHQRRAHGVPAIQTLAGGPPPAEHDLSVPAPWEQMDTRS